MALKKVKIEWIKRDEKQGSNGSFTTCNIKTTVNGQDQWYNGYSNKHNKSWEEGDVVLIDAYQNDKGYWNYNVPDPAEINLQYIKALMKKMDRIEAKVDQLVANISPAHQATRNQSPNARQPQQDPPNQPQNPPRGKQPSHDPGGPQNQNTAQRDNVNMGNLDDIDDDLPF